MKHFLCDDKHCQNNFGSNSLLDQRKRLDNIGLDSQTCSKVGRCLGWEKATRRQIMLNLILKRFTSVPLPVCAVEQKHSVTSESSLICSEWKVSAAQYHQMFKGLYMFGETFKCGQRGSFFFSNCSGLILWLGVSLASVYNLLWK